MIDRPRFDVDDTTTSYSPPRTDRPRWVDQGWGTPQPAQSQTPQHWFDPNVFQAQQPPEQPRTSSGRRRGRAPVAAALVVVSVLSAGLAAGGTVAVLSAGGYLDRTNSGPGGPTGFQTVATVPQNVTISETSAIISAAQTVSPAVVTITARGSVTNGADPFQVPATGVGSGILYDTRGWVLTNRHVVCGADSLTVKLSDGQKFQAATWGIDTLTDLAIVKIDGAGLPAARLGDSSLLRTGQLAVAIGSPLGTLSNSVTSGVVSAVGRELTVDDLCAAGEQRTLRDLIQTDAAINPGNSGGALVDSSGAVIGVNTAVAGNAQGIGFAIPINIAKPIMEQAVDGKDLTRPWIGVFYEPVTPGLADQNGLPIDYGVLVTRPDTSDQPAVVVDSPADRAGVREGDIITAIDDVRIDASNTLDDILTRYKPDDELGLTIVRNGETLQVTLTLGTRPAQL